MIYVHVQFANEQLRSAGLYQIRTGQWYDYFKPMVLLGLFQNGAKLGKQADGLNTNDLNGTQPVNNDEAAGATDQQETKVSS